MSHADIDGIRNLRGWLTQVVARVCLDILRGACLAARGIPGRTLPDQSFLPVANLSWPGRQNKPGLVSRKGISRARSPACSTTTGDHDHPTELLPV